MSLILLSRVATGEVIDGDDQYNSFYFNTLDPDGIIVVFTGIDTSGYERTLDELIWTDPSDGDTYRYDGSNGVNRTAGAGIPAPVYPNITTAYGLKYSMEYKDWDNQIIREEIYEKDYAGAEIEIYGQAEPFILTRENEDDVFPRFRGSGATLNLQTPTSDFYSALFTGDERQYFLIHKEAGTAKWTGWIQPDIYTEPYMPGPYQVSVRFSDGIALLKDTPFPDITTNLYTGTVTEKDVIIGCLQTLYTRLDVWIGLNISSENMDGLSTPIEQSFVNMKTFVEEKNGESLPLSCYEVLEKILTSWNAVLFQENNHWTIIRESELYGGSVAYKIFNYQGIAQSTSTWSTPQTFTTAGIKLHGALRESVQAYKNLSVSQEFGGLLVEKNNFAVNGDFEKWEFIYVPPFTGLWRLENWIYNNLEIFPYNKFTGSVRRVEESTGIDQTNNYINIYGVVRSFSDTGVGYLESKPEPIEAEVGNVINVSFKMRCNTAGSDQRLVEAYFNIALKCGTQWLAVNDTTGEYEWSGTETRVRWKVASVMVWENISIDSLPVPENGNLSIRLYQIVQVGSVSKVQYVCDFDDVLVNLAENPAIANQRAYYKTTNPDNFTNTLPDLKIELGDALTVLSQNAKIVDSEVTKLWTRPSESPGQPLAKLLAREYLNQYQRTSYKLTGGQCRTSLSLFNRYEDAVNMSGKYFIFSGGSFRAKSGYWTANFLEINQTETGTEIREVLEPRTDSSQGSSSGGSTGSAQPEAPSQTPPPNGITVRGTLVFNSAIEVEAADYEWSIDAVPYEGGTDTLAVTGTPTAYSRIDALIGNASGGYEWAVGTESEDTLIDPTIPDGKILLEKVLRETSGTNTLIPVDPDLSNFVDKTFTGNQEILSDFTIKAQKGSLPNFTTFDANGKLIRNSTSNAGIFTTLEGIGGYSKILTITIDVSVQLNYFSVIQFFGISTNYEKGELWVQFTLDGSGDISQNSLKCFGEFDVSKYKLIKTSSSTYELFAVHDEIVSFYQFRPISQFGNSTRYVYYNLDAKVDPLPAGDQYSFTEYGGGATGGEGITLNNKVIGGVKSFIESADVLDIPQYWEYNLYKIDVDGTVLLDGEINIIEDGIVSGGGGNSFAYTIKTSAYTITNDDYFVEASSGTFTFTLPTAIGIAGKSFVIKNSGDGIITVDGNGSQTIDGNLTIELTTEQSVTLVSNGSNFIIS